MKSKNMNLFVYDFKDKEIKNNNTEEYIKKYQYLNHNFRGIWKPNTDYNRGDVVFNNIDDKIFYILYNSGKSNNSTSPETDSLKWEKYNTFDTFQVKDFCKILLKSKDVIDKYTSDKKYYDVYNVGTNVKIEQIAFEVYQDTNYCDVIMALNNLKSYTNMPISSDLIIRKAQKKLLKYAEDFYYNEEDLKFVFNKIETGVLGYYKNISAEFQDLTDTGIYRLNKGDIFKVQNDMYILNTVIPQVSTITFNSAYFPLNTNDVISLRINSRDITFTAVGGENIHDVITNGVNGLKELLIASNFSELKPIITDDNTYIKLESTEEFPRFSIRKNNINASSVPEAFNLIQENESFTINDAINAGYIEETNTTFTEADPSKYEYYMKLYNTYKRYYDEIENKNIKYIKVLKKAYIDDFKADFYIINSEEG